MLDYDFDFNRFQCNITFNVVIFTFFDFYSRYYNCTFDVKVIKYQSKRKPYIRMESGLIHSYKSNHFCSLIIFFCIFELIIVTIDIKAVNHN